MISEPVPFSISLPPDSPSENVTVQDTHQSPQNPKLQSIEVERGGGGLIRAVLSGPVRDAGIGSSAAERRPGMARWHELLAYFGRVPDCGGSRIAVGLHVARCAAYRVLVPVPIYMPT